MYATLVAASGFLALASSIYQSNLAYNKKYTFNVNNSEQCVLQFSNVAQREPPRVTINSASAVVTEPLQILVRQSREQLAWQLPLVLENNAGPDIVFSGTSRVLCHRYAYPPPPPPPGKTTRYNYPIIIVGTASQKDVDFTVEVEYETDFFLEPKIEKNFTIAPNEPLYYFYNFTEGKSKSNDSSGNYDTVVLEISSDDPICMSVSIQNGSCPACDNEDDAKDKGYYQTINHKGGFTIPKAKFPLGFHAVFAVKFDDEDCVHEEDLSQKALIDEFRKKSVMVVIKPTLTYRDYVIVVVVTVICVAAFCIVVSLAYSIILAHDHENDSKESNQRENTPLLNQPDISGYSRPEYAPIDGATNEAPNEETEHVHSNMVNINTISGYTFMGSTTSLAMAGTNYTSNKFMYLYSAFLVGTFYALPAIQLVIENQILLNQSGEQDLCYYNFLCIHSVGYLSDFNHLFSNIGYVCLGLVFVLITYLKARSLKNSDLHERPMEMNDSGSIIRYGIPKHDEMFYAMGVSLAVEGVMSGAYHVCPKETNFQFDASFMYVTVMLCLVKLYQSRNHKANAPAHVTFGVLAVAVCLGMLRVLHHYFNFWMVFTVFYLIGCMFLSIKVYYQNDSEFGWSNLKRKLQEIRSDRVFQHPSRMILIIAGNLANWIVVIVGLVLRFDFSLFLLVVLITNTLIYFTYYVSMKVYYFYWCGIAGEKVRILSWVYLTMALICGVAALWCFENTSIAWNKTPAESRYLNQSCKLWNFYDYHDIWHFLSAMAMFFLFMCFLTLDDNLSHTPSSQIESF